MDRRLKDLNGSPLVPQSSELRENMTAELLVARVRELEDILAGKRCKRGCGFKVPTIYQYVAVQYVKLQLILCLLSLFMLKARKRHYLPSLRN